MTRAPSDAGVENVGGVTDMIERIARRLCAALVPEASQAVIDEAWPDYVFAARAAFEAAYDLTPELLAVAWRAFRGDRKTLPIGPGPAFKEAFLAVRDAALRDGEG